MLKFKLYFLITLSVINIEESNGDNTVPHDGKTTFECVTTRLAKARIHLLRVHTNDKSKYTVILSQNKLLIIY